MITTPIDIAAHNHLLAKELWTQEPENRRLNADEEIQAKRLLSRYAPIAEVTKAISVATKKNVRSKDLHNLAQRTRLDERQGQSEDECVQSFMDQLKAADPDAYIRSDDLGKRQTQVIAIVTSDMMKSYKASPAVLSLMAPTRFVDCSSHAL